MLGTSLKVLGGWVVGGTYTKFSVLLWATALVLAKAQAEQYNGGYCYEERMKQNWKNRALWEREGFKKIEFSIKHLIILTKIRVNYPIWPHEHS